jgi:MOSC domain-containing protein YiiM
VAVCRLGFHQLSKEPVPSIRLVAGLGVEGDCHAGALMQHRSRDPSLPNLRQVHLLHFELLDELGLAPGQMGENVATQGLDLLALPRGTRLSFGSAVVEVTGLRNPCKQLEGLRPGLMAAVLSRDAEGNLVRRAGVMGIVLAGGEVRPGDGIEVQLPPAPHLRLEPV